MTKKVDLIHMGPQKSGTTWLYECLKEHPGCQVSRRDTIHYFDIYHSMGEDWLDGHYEGGGSGQLRVDMTPSYIRDSRALKRIADYNPSRGVAMCLRNPIERAFSHYWHEKKKGRFNYNFKEVVENYDLWSSWIKPGLYSQKIRNCQEVFGKDRVLIQFFDDLNSDPNGFFRQFCEFSGLDPSFIPSMLNEKVNAATPKLSVRARGRRAKARELLKDLGLLEAAKKIKPGFEWVPGVGVQQQNRESLEDINPQFLEQLAELIVDDINNVESITGRDLKHWKRMLNK